MTDPGAVGTDLRTGLAEALRLQAAGREQKARALCDRLLSEYPDSVPLLATRARIARLAGDHTLALSLLNKAIALAPASVAVLSELGQTAMSAGRHKDAVAYFATVAKIRPDKADAWFNLGFASESCHQHEAAIDAYKKALDAGAAADGEILTRLGGVLLVTGQEAQALACFDRALTDQPDNPQALYGKGMVVQAMGDFDAAADLFTQALAADPGFVEVYQQLAELRKFDDVTDPLLVRMAAMLTENLSAPAQEKLHFALGKAYNDCGDYDVAFKHFQLANSLKKARQPAFDRDAFQALTTGLIRYFDKDRLAAKAQAAEFPVTPVFIVGMPRSGTTLIEQILTSHTDVGGAGELAFMDRLSRVGVQDYPQGLDHLTDADFVRFRADYQQEIAAHLGGHRIVTDKFPGNFLHLGLINALFPQARFIFCKRDAMDNCLSVFIQDFGTGNYYANDMQDIAFYYRGHEEVMAHWQALFGERLLQMDYEKLVENQEAETRRLLSFLGLAWQDACLAFENNPRTISTLSRWQVRQPIYKSAAGRWRRYAKHLSALQRALDYQDRTPNKD